MADSSSTTLSPVPPIANSYAPLSAAAVPHGTPIRTGTTGEGFLNNEGVAARANSTTNTFVTGLASRSAAAAGERFQVVSEGVLKLSTEQWDAVTGGSGGLTPNAPYYLSSATAGKLTTTKPVGGGTFVAPVGLALSATELMVQISFPTANS